MSNELERTSDGSGATRHWRQDATLVGVVTVAFLAARLLHGTPLAVAVCVVLTGVLLIRPRVVVVGLFLVMAWHAGHDLDELAPATSRPLNAEFVVVTADPKSDSGRVTAQARVAGERVLLTARSTQSGALRTAATGDRLLVSGTLRGSVPSTSWRISRRIVGTIDATEVLMVEEARGGRGAANTLRDSIRRGADSLSPDRRVLFTGLVFGDDRGQSVIVADNFRASGLGHLLAVSGQNVVFVLLLAGPVILRFSSPAVRVVLSLAVLAGFGFLTRFEPSVTRALVMAGLALLAHAAGRANRAPDVLPPTVLGLLLLDPLLAWSLAFQLSVAATTGLVVLSPRLAEYMPAPPIIALPVSATLGAQLAVSPLLMATFGTVSIVAVPANLLAAPAAAGVMMWGLVAGSIAGVVAPEVAWLLHIPTRAMLWWIDGVAAAFAQVPVGHFGGLQLTAAVVSTALLVAGRRGVVPGAAGFAATAVLVAATVLPLVTPRQLVAGHHRLADGVAVVRSAAGHDVVILSEVARTPDAVSALRRARLGRIDLVIARDGTRSTGQLVRIVQERFDVVESWAPLGHQVPGAFTVEPMGGVVGTLLVETTPNGALSVVDLGAGKLQEGASG